MKPCDIPHSSFRTLIEMDKYVSFLLLATIATAVSGKSVLDNYYWREYKGVIPEDALPAGHDQNGHLIYIGQVLDGEKLIPGKINLNDEKIHYEYGERAWTTKKNIKILCTDNSEKFVWLPTTIHDIHKLRKETNLIKGGYQADFLTFIGRVHLDGRTEVGKVICTQTDCLALYTNEDEHYREYHKFEILAYSPDMENSVLTSDHDKDNSIFVYDTNTANTINEEVVVVRGIN